MSKRIDAKEAAKELALDGLPPRKIIQELEKRGLGDQLDRYEIDAIASEMDSVRRLLPQRPSKALPRLIGIIAILLGIWGMSIGGVGRRSPGGFGMLALILGTVLVLRPDLAKEKP